jgi:hypothetical protein
MSQLRCSKSKVNRPACKSLDLRKKESSKDSKVFCVHRSNQDSK